MGLIRSLAGMVTVELTSADPGAALAALAQRDIPVFDAEPVGELSLIFWIRREDYRAAARLCEKRGDTFRLRRRTGIYWTLKGLLKRPVLVAGAAVLTGLMLYVPSRVLFVRVEGNTSVPTNLILEAAEESGIGFGASRREVRSEKMKNTLLEAVPELQWAGVNTRGCVAVITVRERSVTEEKAEEKGVSSIVASTDGVILSATATKGSLQCQPGQAVVAGQVLISGYTDCGLMIQADRAEGEVYARTRHESAAVIPAAYTKRGEIREERTSYSLIVGKKRINLWKDSGISDSSCGRMYEEYYITLPGGFTLPVALVKETTIRYDQEEAEYGAEEVRQALEEFSAECAAQAMIAGTIEEGKFTLEAPDGCFRVTGSFLCTEMIGRQRAVEIGDIHG